MAVLLVGVVPGSSRSVPVMTRNLYLGADITRPVRATTGRTGEAALLGLGHANAELRRIVGRTNFAVRGRLLAGEMSAARPDLVGLQEVALWRSGPLRLDQLGRLTASHVDVDFLQTLLVDLARRSVSYDVVAVQPESDVQAPAFDGPLATAAATGQDVRLTVRDVILLRHDAGLRVLASGGAHYRHQVSVDLGGIPYAFVRGYAWVDVAAGRTRFRFVTTHLESQSADVALAQAQELLAGPAVSTSLTTVVVCDCNSDPASSSVRPGDSVPRSAAYQSLRRAGFADEWLAQQPTTGPGFTSGLGELVDDSSAAGFTRRLDLVLARPGRFRTVSAAGGQLSGNESSDRDPATGLWPSDHAGVVLRLRIR